jgi:hypothetical protein
VLIAFYLFLLFVAPRKLQDSRVDISHYAFAVASKHPVILDTIDQVQQMTSDPSLAFTIARNIALGSQNVLLQIFRAGAGSWQLGGGKWPTESLNLRFNCPGPLVEAVRRYERPLKCLKSSTFENVAQRQLDAAIQSQYFDTNGRYALHFDPAEWILSKSKWIRQDTQVKIYLNCKMRV